jgi:hypothetical protein
VHRAVLLVVLSPLLADDAPPRSKAADYPVQASLPGMEIAAEYLLHSIPIGKGYYFAKDYLVVDVGVFPSSREPVKILSGQFTLRINHGKSDLSPESAGTVAASIKYPDWEQHSNVTAGAGPVIIGDPPTVGRFPGDRRQSPTVIPPVPEEQEPGGIEKEAPKTVDQLIAAAALPEGPTAKPANGCLFFRFRGKTKSIHSLELVYDAGEGRPKATLTLF